VANSVEALSELAELVNLGGLEAFEATGDPSDWPEGFTDPPVSDGTASEVPQPALNEVVAGIDAGWTVAFQNLDEVPGPVEEAFTVLFDAFNQPDDATGLSVFEVLAQLGETPWVELAASVEPTDPPLPLTVAVAGTLAGTLKALDTTGDALADALGVITAYITETGCVTPIEDFIDPENDVPGFCAVLTEALDTDVAARFRAVLTETSVTDPSVVDNDGLLELADAAYGLVLDGEVTAPPSELGNWQVVTRDIVDLYAVLQSYSWDWATVLEPVRAEVVAALNDGGADPVRDAAEAELAVWFAGNCTSPATVATVATQAGPRFTG
jgi:hypothetical protein